MTIQQWWDKNNMDAAPNADRTFGEEVWKDAQRDVWVTVFRAVSDHSYNGARELIKRLEVVRGEAGYGPESATV